MKYFEIADKTKINWVETDIFAGLSYLDDIIEPKDWNDFVEYVDEVFNFDLRYVPPTAVFSIGEMLEWADSYRGI